MAKKTHLKVRMVPESKPDSAFVYYAKKPPKVKSKVKLRLKSIIRTRENTSFLLKKITTSKIIIFKISKSYLIYSDHCFPNFV